MGVQGMFVLTSSLAVVSMILIWKWVPTPVQTHNLEVKAIPSQMLGLLQDKQLIRLDLGIFILHFVLTGMFVVVPITLVEQLSLPTDQHWQVYVPALLISIVLMVPLMITSARQNWLPRVFLIGVCLLLLAQSLLLLQSDSIVVLTACLLVFFWGFNLLEAMLPSLVSRLAPAASRGSAMGVYNTFQFAGVFFGGLAGGALYGELGSHAVFFVNALLLVLWIYLIYSAPTFVLLDSVVVRLPNLGKESNINKTEEISVLLMKVKGVKEVVIVEEDAVAYLKVNKRSLDQRELDRLVASYSG
jgi:predicted MFS family arabinose efflux permease